ncbi:MAG: hypothetical protein Q8J64_09930 [Thermodesulfovibrionales bacterium]|nr:hypothetical protein [Thermodesulfovibrionales bacterium]
MFSWKTIKSLLWLALFALLVYSAAMFSMPYYRHYALEADLKDIITYHFDPPELKALILEQVEKSDAPINPSDVAIVFGEKGSVVLKITWSETVNILDLYSRKIDFKIELNKI